MNDSEAKNLRVALRNEEEKVHLRDETIADLKKLVEELSGVSRAATPSASAREEEMVSLTDDANANSAKDCVLAADCEETTRAKHHQVPCIALILFICFCCFYLSLQLSICF